jgi:hypothetical protein
MRLVLPSRRDATRNREGHHELHTTCREASNVHGPEVVWCLNARNRGLRAAATSGERPFSGKVISEISLLPVMYLQGLSLPTVLD